MERKLTWFPFTAGQVEIVLGLAGLGATATSLLGVPGRAVVIGTASFLFVLFVIGLLSVAAGNRVARVHLDGALHGRGYSHLFREARRSLLLIHLDDDAPDGELQALYRRLLDQGVAVRRLVFVRPDHRAEGIHWITQFGSHPLLRQRFVEVKHGSPLTMSFAIIDEGVVLLALPGFRSTETETYSDSIVLRHLIELRHPAASRAFLEVYESAWKRATSFEPGEAAR